MAVRIQNITNEADQRHTIITENQDVILRLYFLPTVQSWFMDVSYGDKSVKGVRLSLAVSHIRASNLPLDFIVEDTLNQGIDPFKLDDFFTGRCNLYMMSADDMTDIRGQSVPV